MSEPKDPFDEEAAQRADHNRAHDIVVQNAPPFASGDFPPANDNQPLTPEEKHALSIWELPSRTEDRPRDREDPKPGSKDWVEWLQELGTITPAADREKRRDDPERER